MHWRTFERLRAEHDRFLAESLDGMAASFGWDDELQSERKPLTE
jgi:hypothetical protein